MLLRIPIIIFVVLELLNVTLLYYKPDFEHGNSMAVFKNFIYPINESVNLFNRYMVNWVGNSKLIFIALLVMIVIMGEDDMLVVTNMLLVIMIGAYFTRLAPIMKELDNGDHLTSKGYSKQLNLTILIFMLMFTIPTILYFL